MSKEPLVTCILAARGGATAVLRAVYYFLRQDYEQRELIIIDGSGNPVGDALPVTGNLRYLQHGPEVSSTDMLELASREARGELIAYWDDRAWYASDYLLHLVSAMAGAEADVYGPSVVRYCDPESGHAWEVETERGQRWVLPPAAVCYRESFRETDPRIRALWRESGELSGSREERIALTPGAVRLVLFAPPPVLTDPAWGRRLSPDTIRDAMGADWRSHNPADLRPQPAIAVALEDDPQSHPALEKSGQPLVSCILQATDGRLAAAALRSFASQDYQARELIVVHTGGFDTHMAAADSRVRFLRIPPDLEAGPRRNLAAGEARGEILMHWEETAWHSPQCVRRMAETLVRSSADVCVFNPALAYDRKGGQAWIFDQPIVERPRQNGALCYRKGFWADHPFPNTDCHADVRFVARAAPGRVAATPGAGCQVSLLLPPGPLGERKDSAYWRLYPTAELDRVGGERWRRYLSVGAFQGSTGSATAQDSQRPLVSCVLVPGRGRKFLAQSIRYFLRQDYEPKELLILDANTAPFADVQLQDPRVRYIHLERGAEPASAWITGCEQAIGEIILHWTAGSWYANDRISHMAGPIAAGEADIVAGDSVVYCDAKEGTVLRRAEAETDLREFHVSSVCYRRFLWTETRYPENESDDRVAFVGPAGLARLTRIDSSQFQIVMSPDVQGSGGTGGPSDDIQRLLGEDWDVYLAKAPPLAWSGAMPALDETPVLFSDGEEPMVSCIMPTYNRRRFVPLAIQYFLRQDYTNSELIIVDDGSDPINDLVPSDPRIRYIRLETKISVGAKRNLACEHARGKIIQHWDDDDWQAPYRVRFMVEGLLEHQAELCGLNPFVAYDLQGGQSWLYRYPYAGNFWVAGTSLCYLRRLWERRHFDDVNVGEDNQFVWNTPANRLFVLPDRHCVVCIMHDQNVSPKNPHTEPWDPYPMDDLRKAMGADWDIYQALRAAPYSGNGKPQAAFTQNPLSNANRMSAPFHMGVDAPRRTVNSGLPALEPPRPSSTLINMDGWRCRRQSSGSDVPGPRAQLAGRLAQLGHTLLDIGCGPGAIWRHIMPHRELSCIGVDINRAMVAAAHALFPSLHACCADGKRLPFRDRSFDVVLCRHLLEFSSNSMALQILGEAIRVARRAIVLDFYGPLQPASAIALATSLDGAGWSIRERLAVSGLHEKDDVWIAHQLEAV